MFIHATKSEVRQTPMPWTGASIARASVGFPMQPEVLNAGLLHSSRHRSAILSILFTSAAVGITAGIVFAVIMTPIPIRLALAVLGIEAEGVAGSWTKGVFASRRLRLSGTLGSVDLRYVQVRLQIGFDAGGIAIRIAKASARSASLQLARGFDAATFHEFILGKIGSLNIDETSIDSLDISAEDSRLKITAAKLQVFGISTAPSVETAYKQLLFNGESVGVRATQLVQKQAHWSVKGGLDIIVARRFAPLFVKRDLAINIVEAGNPPVLSAQVSSQGVRVACESLGDAVASDVAGDWLIDRLVDDLKIVAWRACGERAKQQPQLSVDARAMLNKSVSQMPPASREPATESAAELAGALAPVVVDILPSKVADPVDE